MNFDIAKRVIEYIESNHLFMVGPITCDMTSEGKVKPWKHGAAIATALKNVKMDGLTGSIRYDEL